MLVKLDDSAQIVFIDTLLDPDVRILLKLSLLCLSLQKQIGVVFMLQTIYFFYVYVNQSIKSFSNAFLILSFNKHFTRVFFLHCHGRCYLNLEFWLVGLSVMFSLFQNRENNFLFLTHFTLNYISLMVL